MNLSVVILNWNAAKDTSECLGRLKAWSSTAKLPATTVWVVDNGSRTSEVEALERAHQEVRFLKSPDNRGYGGGNNLGMAAAMESGSDAILLLNNDASVDGRSVASMLAALASDPGIGVVGPTLWYGPELVSAGGRDIALHSATHLRPRRPPEKLLDVDYVSGTVALLSRAVVDAVGLLDERYFFGGEMADFCCRARLAGFRSVTDPGARATHDLGRSSELRERLHLYYVFRNRFLYVGKHYPQRRARLFALWVMRGMRAVVSALARGNLRRARTVALAVLDGLTARFGGQNRRVLG